MYAKENFKLDEWIDPLLKKNSKKALANQIGFESKERVIRNPGSAKEQEADCKTHAL